MKRAAACFLALGLLVLSPGAAAAWRRTGERLREVLEREVALTQASAETHRHLALLDRERASLRYTAGVLDHASSESMRRLEAYRRHRGRRDERARARAKVLYKLSRGGLARLALEDGGRDGADRVRQGRALRAIVAHDLRELRAHRRASRRATGELVSAARELQALAALTWVQSMQEHALVSTHLHLQPELSRAWSRRRRASESADEKALRANRDLMRLVRSQWRTLRELRGLDGAMRLVRPVPGRVRGAFGEYLDPILRLPAVRSGVELDARVGESVRAMADGRVVLVSELPAYGTAVVTDHGGGQYTLTARMWQIEVSEGQDVEAGQLLGRVAPKRVDDGLGTTVYVELRHGEKPVDPTRYLRRAE